MPKVPGRKSTRLTYDLNDLAIASFLVHGMDDRFFKSRICVVDGCGHRVDNCIEGNAAGPAVAVWNDDIDTQVGLICQHHVAELLDR